jgi:ABC-type multidrug transport system ATPase subunit
MCAGPASTPGRPGGLAIEAEGVVKRFGKVEALSGLDLVAQRGQVTAVLGPNGAGKTTFVRAVATLIRPQAGTLRVHGVDVVRQPGKVRRMIGLAGQFAAVEPALTGRENIHMVARLYGQPARQAAAAAAAVLGQLGLDEVADRPVKTYPGGCSAASTWAPAWSAPPGRCCSTSRPPAWTRAAAASCGRPSAGWRHRAPTCC